MRRTALLLIGLLECFVAIGLGLLASRLPKSDQVAGSFSRFSQVTMGAEDQIVVLQKQIEDLQRPEMHQVAKELGSQTRQITQLLQRSQIDFPAIEAMSRGLNDVAAGLDGFASTLDADRLIKLGDALGTAAQFLDRNLVESSQAAASQLDEALVVLRKDAMLLTAILQKAPPDLQAMRDIHDSLSKFDAGLERVNTVLKLQQFETIREGITGLETSLSTTAAQVDRLSNFTYPVIQLNGLKPNIEQRPFWPEGATIAEGLRKAVKGMQAAGTELEGIHKELPTLRIALDDSRKIIHRTREAMGKALSQQGEIEGLLREVPKQSAQLAERLPKLGESFAKMLRETQRLKDVAEALRQTQKGLSNAAEQWPRLREAMAKSAAVLRTTQNQFDKLVQNRAQYETAFQGTTHMAERFADLLPVIHDQLDVRLSQQEQTLAQLKTGLAQVNAGLPDAATGTAEMLNMGRWLLWLVSGLVGLHGVFVGVDAFTRKPTR